MSTFFTSESVTEGHPDKICDQISDAVLDAALAADPLSRVACDCAVTENFLLVTGEISTRASLDVPAIARAVIRDIGYTTPGLGFAADSVEVLVKLAEQSPDIAQGVDAVSGKEQGAGDQGIMFGYAMRETPEYLPLPVALAHRLARRLTEVRKTGLLPYLRPDGKTQVTVEYGDDGRPSRLEAVVVSAQHAEGIERATLRRDLFDRVIVPVCGELLDERTNIHVNPTGRFVKGGPAADSGLTGRKIIVDTYGGMGRHGGGAFSGKDPTKVDRSGAYAARWVAKNVVAAGLADRCEVQVGYAIGVARPVSLLVQTFGTSRVPEADIVRGIRETFDLRPASIMKDLDLTSVRYRPFAAYGHMGRTDLDAPWERTDRAEALQRSTVMGSIHSPRLSSACA